VPKYSSLQDRNAQRKRYYRKHRRHALAKYTTWTTADEMQVLQHSVPDVELAAKLGRSVEAIQVKRCKLKKHQTAATA
jgi:hypothetical protein